MLRMFKTYWKARKAFIFPKLHVYIGRWRNDPCLPIWRRGNCIWLIRAKHMHDFCYRCKYGNVVSVWFRDKNGKINLSDHKLNHDAYAIRPIRRKIKKWHLSWLPAKIELPMWLSFYKFSNDVIWKTKWDEIRYEFPPQFTIVAFGLSFSMWLCPEFKSKDSWRLNYDHYWETLLTYVYRNVKSYEELRKRLGEWTYMKDGDERTYTTVQPEYFKKKFLNK